MPRIDFLKESLVQAEERVRSLNAEVAEASINKEKLGQLEAQLLAVETKKAKTIADLAEENDRKIAMLAGDLVIIFLSFIILEMPSYSCFFSCKQMLSQLDLFLPMKVLLIIIVHIAS